MTRSDHVMAPFKVGSHLNGDHKDEDDHDLTHEEEGGEHLHVTVAENVMEAV